MYTRYFSRVQHYISLFTSPGGDHLDELTQDVFVRIWEKKEKLSGVDSFVNYLFLVCRNVVFNYFRAMKVQQRVRELDMEEAGPVGG